MLSLVPEIFLEHFLSVRENNLTKPQTPKLIELVRIIWTTEGTGENIFRRSSWGKFGRSLQGKKLFWKYCIGKLHVLYIFAYTFKIPLCLTWILFPKKSLGHV